MTKRIISLLTTITMIFGLVGVLPLNAFSTVGAENVFAGGDGSAESPYQVSTPKQLDAVRNNLSAHYVQINNIDLSKIAWVPIGSDANPFTGSYNGKNYVLKNLKYDDINFQYPYNYHHGLFGYNLGDLKNIRLENISITGFSPDFIEGWQVNFIGGITGINSGSIDSCEIKSGKIETWITHDGEKCIYGGGKFFVGGICGNNSGTIYRCKNSANIYINSTQAAFVGGISGGNSDGQIKCSFNTADLSAYCKLGDYRWRREIYSFAYGIAATDPTESSKGEIIDCLCASKNITASGVRQYTSDYYEIGAGLIGNHKSGNNYVFKDAYCAVGGQQVSMVDADNVIYTDLDTIMTIWDSYQDSPYPIIKQLYFEEPITILNVEETKQLTVHSRDVSNENGELVYSNDRVMDNNELVWNSAYYKDNGIIEMSDTGEVTALSNGIEYVSVHSKDDISLGTSCHVFVGKPNEFSYTATYDTKQYYAEGGFFSEKSSVSDCVEIYMLLENKLADQLKDLTDIEDELNSDDAKTRFKDIAPITLTATVNGNDLSFSRDTYTNTYSTTFDALSVGKAVDDVLMLFPTDDINIAPLGNTYTVKVTLESESFDTVTEEYNFTIENLETKSANEHITFTTSNDYKKSKENIYGEAMATMKNDAEYWVSKFYSFDFENYYEVVFADVLVELMDVNQMRHISLLPVIKEWVGNYNTILSSVSKIVEEDGSSGIKVPDNAVDKLLKKSKYVTDGMDVDDELRDLVVMKLHEKVSIDKINSAFAVVDKTQQFYSFFKLGVNITNDIADYINSVSILNTYKEMNDDFKTVIKQLYDNIPDSESKLKSAVNHYVNLNTDLGQSEEYFSEVISLSKNITLDVFKTVYKAQFSAALVKSIGSISIKGGVALSSTAAFSSISTGLSAGTTLGLCISDFLCDNSGKSVELGKTIAMSEFSPYVINTLNHYESNLYSERNDTAVAEFENAFALHKATQSYIMEHTIKALETKRDSIIIKLFSRDDYDELISDILAQKSAIDNLKCHNDMQESTVVNKTKVIAIKCPVDVYVYDENGKEIVRIVKDITENVAERINLFIEDGKKYIALPANQNYSLKIVATDKGEMEYRVTEYGDGVERLRTVTISKIPLITGRVFTGEIAESMEVSSDDYALMYVDSSDTPSQKPTTTPTTTKSPNINIKSKSTLTKSTSPTAIKKAKVKNLKVKTKGKKITVSWKKIKIAKGYQVQVATNKKFKKKKIVFDKFTKKRKLIIKSSKIKRKKTYYVRVRAYAKGNGKKAYGKWSKKIRVKIK